MHKIGGDRCWIPMPEFEQTLSESARIVHERGWRMTVPALAEVSRQYDRRMNDKRIRHRLDRYPDLKAKLGVVPANLTGRYAATERRR